MLRNLLIASKIFRSVVIAMIFFAASSCQKNYFQGFGTQTDDESLYFTAREYLRNSSYTNAISSCAALSATYLKRDDVAIVCASAFAGRAGYSLSWMETNLAAILAAPPILKKMFVTQFLSIAAATATTNVADLDAAESILRNIGSASVRSDDANMFMAMLSIYKLGMLAKSLADTNSDGTLDPAFDACGTVSVANQKLFGSALWELKASTTAISAISFIAPVYTAVNTLCTTLAGAPISEDLCGATDPTNLSATQLKGAMSAVKEGGAFGVGQCGALGGACYCP